jgi:hypothetical protein
MNWILAIATVASATTFPPATPLSEQIEGADAVGVYVVGATKTVTLPDGFVATRAQIDAAAAPVKGDVRSGTLGVPGGWLGDRYVESFEGAPIVSTGDTLFLFLRAHEDRYILAYGFSAGLYRRVVSDTGPIMVDGEGEPVTGVSCDARPERGDGAPLSWDAAVQAFTACGGAP